MRDYLFDSFWTQVDYTLIAGVFIGPGFVVFIVLMYFIDRILSHFRRNDKENES